VHVVKNAQQRWRHDGRTKENTEITIMHRVFENDSGSKNGVCVPANITVVGHICRSVCVRAHMYFFYVIVITESSMRIPCLRCATPKIITTRVTLPLLLSAQQSASTIKYQTLKYQRYSPFRHLALVTQRLSVAIYVVGDSSSIL